MRILLIVVAVLSLSLCGHASVTPVGNCQTGGVAGATTLDCNLASTVYAGSYFCAYFTQDTASTVTLTTTGESNITSEETGYPKRGATSSAHFGHVMRLLNPGSVVRATFSQSITGGGICSSYGSDVDYIEQVVLGVTGTGTSISRTITTTHSNDVIVIGGGIKTGGVTFTGGAGVTVALQRAGGSQSEFMAYMNTTTAGQYTFTITTSSSGEFVAGGVVAATTSSVPSLSVAPKMTLPSGYIASANLGVNQGVARNATKIFTTACYENCADSNSQWKLASWTVGSGGLPGTNLSNTDIHADFSVAPTQINGIYWESSTNRIYVAGMNYAGAGQSEVVVYDSDNLVGGKITNHLLRSLGTEGVTKHDATGKWFAFYVSTNSIDEYDSSWNFVRAHAMPNGPAGTAAQWQFCGFEPDSGYLFCNPHDLNPDHNMYVFSYDTTTGDFSYRGKFQQVVPGGSLGADTGCGQGGFFYKKMLYWACRWTGTNPGKVIISNWESGTALLFTIP